MNKREANYRVRYHFEAPDQDGRPATVCGVQSLAVAGFKVTSDWEEVTCANCLKVKYSAMKYFRPLPEGKRAHGG